MPTVTMAPSDILDGFFRNLLITRLYLAHVVPPKLLVLPLLHSGWFIGTSVVDHTPSYPSAEKDVYGGRHG